MDSTEGLDSSLPMIKLLKQVFEKKTVLENHKKIWGNPNYCIIAGILVF